MQKQQYEAKDEQALMTFLWSPEIANDPLAFVMAAYPWGKEGTPLANRKGPRKWQKKILNQIKEHIIKGDVFGIREVFKKAMSSGRGSGKSALVAWLNHWFVSTRIGATGVISANRETQLRANTFGEISKWVTMSINSHWWEVVGIMMNPAKWLVTLVETDLKIGTRYWGIEGRLWSEENPDAYAGEHNDLGMMLTFDESSGIPDSIWSVGQGFFTEDITNRFWFAFGNMRRSIGYFFEAVFGSKRDFWDSDVVDSRTVEGVDKKLYQDIIDEYGEDSNEARVEVYGLPPIDDNETFIPWSLAKKAVNRKVEEDSTDPVIITVDPSRGSESGDRFEIGIHKGNKFLEIRRFKLNEETKTMEGVGHIANAIEEFNPDAVIIDETGLGGPIKDRMVEMRYKKIYGINFKWKSSDPRRWVNKRAEIWDLMKDWLSIGSIPDDKRLLTDLTGVKKKPTSEGVLQLEGKKEMKARGLDSPDSGDLLALRFAVRIARREYIEERMKRVQRAVSYVSAPTGTSWMSS